MIEKYFDDILRNQKDPKYDTCREEGRLNVAACLHELGVSPVGGFFIISFYPFPNIDYSLLDFTDFSFNGCMAFNVNFSGAVLTRCEFNLSPLDLSGTRLIDLRISAGDGHPTQFVGSHLTNCRLGSATSYGSELKNMDFSNALIDSDDPDTYGQFFYGYEDSITLYNSRLNNVTIKQQLLDGRFVNCEMVNARVEDCAFHQVSLPETVTDSLFRNVTALVPTSKWQLRFYRVNQSALVFSSFHNNSVDHCQWDQLALLGSASSFELFAEDFTGNSFINNSMRCAFLATNWRVPNRDEYAGETLARLMVATSRGASVQYNDVSAIEKGGRLCLTNTTLLESPVPTGVPTGLPTGVPTGEPTGVPTTRASMTGIPTGAPTMGMSTQAPVTSSSWILELILGSTAFGVGVLVVTCWCCIFPRIKKYWHDLAVEEWREGMWSMQFAPQNERNTLRYQSVMFRLVSRVTLAMAQHANHQQLPDEILSMIIAYFPTINVDNPNLPFRDALIEQRTHTLWRQVHEERHQQLPDPEVRVEVGALPAGLRFFRRRQTGETMPLLGGASFSVNRQDG